MKRARGRFKGVVSLGLVLAVLSGWPARPDHVAWGGKPSDAGAPVSTVLLHVESNEPGVVLARIADDGSSEPYTAVCTEPCDQPIDPRIPYVFENVSNVAGVSDGYVIPDRRRVTLTVDSGSEVLFDLGLFSASAGTGAAAVGGALLTVDAIQGKLSTPGLISLAAGFPLVILGAYWLATNQTTVTDDQGTELDPIPLY
jgi:hypothetical protein